MNLTSIRYAVARVAAASIILTGALSLGIAHADVAGAYCGTADEYGLTLNVGWGLESNYGDPQCGNSGWAYPYGLDGHYRGLVADIATDGSCVYVRYADGWPIIYNAIQGYSCYLGSVYDFYDQDGTTFALFRLEYNWGTSAWYWNSGY